MTSAHSNISIFVPHIGCPNMCSFCNQRHITGTCKAPGEADVDKAVQTALSSRNYDPKNGEIAFFGGSFTAINREYMTALLKAASRHIDEKRASGIRISTRPDAINDEILSLLKKYKVTSIELGAQSMNESVLKKNNRGHTAQDVVRSSLLIKEYGFSLGLQMMTGLYGDTDERALKTAADIIKLKPDTVRIYPTIVLKDTYLAALYADGFYKPQALDSAVALAVKLLEMFEKTSTRVIRLGLHSIEPDSYLAGPWHPAFSELCYSEMLLKSAKEQLNKSGSGKYIIYVNPSDISKMIGQKRQNIEKLSRLGFSCIVRPDEGLKKNTVRTERS